MIEDLVTEMFPNEEIVGQFAPYVISHSVTTINSEGYSDSGLSEDSETISHQGIEAYSFTNQAQVYLEGMEEIYRTKITVEGFPESISIATDFRDNVRKTYEEIAGEDKVINLEEAKAGYQIAKDQLQGLINIAIEEYGADRVNIE